MIERLDARAAHWPRRLRWPYLTVKWFLVVLGVYCLLASAYMERQEHRPGIGTGFLSMLILAAVKGAIMAYDHYRAPK